MLREVIATGATVEEAKENACKELGVETYDDNIEFEIIEMQSKKVFGLFGGHPAKVRVYIKESAAQAAENFIRNIINCMELTGITLSTKEEGELRGYYDNQTNTRTYYRSFYFIPDRSIYSTYGDIIFSKRMTC